MGKLWAVYALKLSSLTDRFNNTELRCFTTTMWIKFPEAVSELKLPLAHYPIISFLSRFLVPFFLTSLLLWVFTQLQNCFCFLRSECLTFFSNHFKNKINSPFISGSCWPQCLAFEFAVMSANQSARTRAWTGRKGGQPTKIIGKWSWGRCSAFPTHFNGSLLFSSLMVILSSCTVTLVLSTGMNHLGQSSSMHENYFQERK